MTWTIAQVVDLQQSWGTGETAASIGLRIGKTKNAVIGKANRMGLVTKSGAERKADREARELREAAKAPFYTAKTCAWPIGDPREPGFHYCGDTPKEGKPYCEHHCGIAYREMTSWEAKI